MTRLPSELQRLFAVPAHAGTLMPGDGGMVRTLVLAWGQPLGVSGLSALWQGVQDAWDWPAPAVALNGADGWELWFSLAQAVPQAQARTVLHGVLQRWAPGAATAHVRLWPSGHDTASHPVPPTMVSPEHWSSFISPGMVTLFADEPWLNVPPNPDKQADLLAPLQGISPAAWARALADVAAAAPEPAAGQAPAPALWTTAAPTAQGWTPRAFLLAVLNDPAVPLPQRLDAAQALLPYEETTGPTPRP